MTTNAPELRSGSGTGTIFMPIASNTRPHDEERKLSDGSADTNTSHRSPKLKTEMVTTEKPKSPQKESHAQSSHRPSSERSSRSSSSSTEAEKLRRAWRSLVSSFLVSTRCAEKQIAKKDMGGKELDESIEQTLKARNEFRRYITTVEAKLMGTAKETEAITGLINTQSRIGRKRKFDH